MTPTVRIPKKHLPRAFAEEIDARLAAKRLAAKPKESRTPPIGLRAMVQKVREAVWA